LRKSRQRATKPSAWTSSSEHSKSHFGQIAQNAGYEGAVVVGGIRESKDDHFGFNAETAEYGDLVKMGVIDPAKVTRLALQNAASVSALMLTTEALVAEIKEEEKKAAAAGVPGGGRY
jgi:chaperonin GroEL